MVEEITPEVEAHLNELDNEQDSWKVAEALRELIPSGKFEGAISDFDSKYSLHGSNVYKDKRRATTLTESNKGTPESIVGFYIAEAKRKHGGLAKACQRDSFDILRAAVVAEWAKRRSYEPRKP
jgi:hypothetical protein